jgi:putative glycosyltransferase (TIGR04372 family)
MLDILVCANARCFVGGTSGLFYACKVFNVPIFITNGIPLTVLPPQPIDLFIPKLIFSIELGRILTINELFKLNLYKLFHSHEYKKNKLIPIENNNEDITRSFINWVESNDNFDFKLIEKYKKNIKSDDYGFNSCGKVCSIFLKKYLC